MDGKEILAKERRDKPAYIVVIGLAFICIIVTIVFNALNGLDVGGLFKRGVGDTSDKYDLDVTPAGWTFAIWAFIYVAQMAMMLYALSLTCRRNELSSRNLYYDPPFLPPTFFGIYMLSCVLNVTWLFAFDGDYIVASLVVLLGLTFSLTLCIFFSVTLMWKYEPELSRKELWLNVILVQNSVGLYTAWVAIATSLNIGIVARYESDYSMDTACWLVLIVIDSLFLIYVLVDFFICTVKLRYQFTPYIVLIIASAGIVDKNVDWDVAYQRFAVGILGTSILLSVVKFVLTIFRAFRQPSPLEVED